MANIFVLLHRDGQEPVTVAEFVVAEAGLFGAEEQCDAGCPVIARHAEAIWIAASGRA